MRHKRARLSLLVAVAAGAAAVVAPAVFAAPDAAGAPGAAPAGPTVTLLTGDRVTIGGMRGVTVQAAKGREHVTFFTETDANGDVTVVPEDALSLLTKGKLDERLFNVTELARIGYDDASRDRLPLIVDYAGATPRSAAAEVSRELPAMSATALSVDRSGSYWPVAQRAEHVWLDGQVRASLDQSVPQIGAPEAWAAGYTGVGTTVAVLDTGVDASHPDLADAVAAAKNFTDSDTADDRDGHGTHVASTITGNGAASGGKYRGVAPDAMLLNGKVLDDYGFGQDSWIIAGMEWAAQSGADVINMSLGTFLPSDGTDPMSQAVNRISAETGTLFVIAAGNNGPVPGWIGSPGAADAALTVGAVDKTNKLAEFSSRGPRWENGGIKPEITAPGVDIVAARATNGQLPDPDGDGYVSLSGTSMATPHVAGAAAIVAGQHPDWTGAQIKSALMGSAKPGDGQTVFQQGAGRVDLAKATSTTVFATSGDLSFGLVQWPHNDDQAITRELTYTNTGSEPVTLDLAADLATPDGSAAPHGMFTVTPETLVVPAGGQATATVRADTAVDGPDGYYEGTVTATGDGQSVRTPAAVNREIESYDVTVKALDYDGAPTENFRPRFVQFEQNDKYRPFVYKPFENGSRTMRLPKGEYTFTATVQQQVGADYRNAEFVEPAYKVAGDAEIVLDARETRPAEATVDNPTARMMYGFFDFRTETDWAGVLGSTAYFPADGSTTLKPATTSSDRFTFAAEAHFARWNGQSFDGSPYLYHVRHVDNTVPRKLKWHFPDRGLAKVTTKFAASRPGTYGRYGNLVFPLPGTLTEYYTPDVPWEAEFAEMSDAAGTQFLSANRQIDRVTFPLGRTTVQWGHGVFGPAMSGAELGPNNANRYRDLLRFTVPMASDPTPGRVGYVAGDGSSQLLRDGVVIGADPDPSGGWYEVGPERAKYTLRTVADRSAFAQLSTKISAEWTFESAHNPEGGSVPLLAARFAPRLDDHNAAPAGRRFTIPFYVQRNGTDGDVRVNQPVVEVSYDDGRTWRPAKVTRDGGRWKATVDHPRGAEFVSLRSNVTDRDGNAQRLTIIRAYALT